MKFPEIARRLTWLFDRCRKTETFQDSENEFLPEQKFQPIPKWTHAGRSGKTIRCYKCSGEMHVYHFGWKSLLCGTCREIIDKSKWLIPVPEEKK